MGTLQVGGTTLGVKNTSTNKVDLSNTGTLDNLPFYACRAWVNFDGTKDTSGSSSTGTTNRLIRGSGNVASVLRNGTGDYTITFTTAMPDVNYSIAATGMRNSTYASGANTVIVGLKSNTVYSNNMSTTSFSITTNFPSDASMHDPIAVTVIIFR